jgi:hypothetical protein
MKKLRVALTTLGILVGPFLVFLISFFVIYSVKHDGIGPGDGDGLEAILASFFIGGVAAIFLWGYGLISILVWSHDRSNSAARQAEPRN